MDPVSQTLAQQTSGSAEGQGFGQFFVEGARLRQNRDQLNLASRRVAIEERQDKREQQKFDLMLPLLTKQQELTNTNLGIEATARQLQLDATTRLNAALPEIFQLQAEMMEKGPDDTGVREKLLDLSKRYGTAFAPGTPGGNLWLQAESAPMFESRMKRIIDAESKLKESGLYLRSSGTKGDIDIGVRNDELQRERLDLQRERLLLERRRLQLSGDAQGLRQVDLELKALEQGFKVEGLGNTSVGTSDATTPDATSAPSATTTPTTPTTPPAAAPPRQVTITPVERPPTTGTATDLQKKNVAADLALQKLDTLKDTIQQNPDAFGVRGVGGEIWETLRGQVDPNLDPRVSNARETAGLAFVELADSLRTDSGNMSLYEQKRLKELGDTRSWSEYPARALGKAETIEKAIVARKLRLVKTLNGKVDDSLLRRISKPELGPLLANGLLTAEDAIRYYRLLKE